MLDVAALRRAWAGPPVLPSASFLVAPAPRWRGAWRAATRPLILAAHYLAARVMSVVTLAVAALFLDAEAFGEAGLYLAVVNLAWLFTFLRYETAVAAAPTDAAAGAVLRLCALVGAGSLTLVTSAALLVGAGGLAPLGLVLLLPLSFLGRAGIRLASMAASRNGDFEGLGRLALVQGAVQPLVLLLAAAGLDHGALALGLADAAGHLAAAAYLCRRHRVMLARIRHPGWSLPLLLATARRHAGLPLVNLPGSLLAFGFTSAPLLLMPFVADPLFAGSVALALRVFDLPTQVIGAATTPYLLNRLRPDADGFGPTFERPAAGLLLGVVGAVYALMAVLLVLAVPHLKGTAFAALAPIVPLVALFQGGIALAGPLGEACALYRAQGRLALVNGLSLLGCGLAGVVALAVSPMAGLAMLATLSLMRALSTAERLRALSRDRREEALFGGLGAVVTAVDSPSPNRQGSLP